MKCPYAFATPYGVTGASGVDSRLRHLGGLAEDLARRRLVDADAVVDRADGLEQRRDADRRELRRLDRVLPRARHERRRREVVHLARPVRAQHARERSLVEQVDLDELDARRAGRTRREASRTTPTTS